MSEFSKDYELIVGEHFRRYQLSALEHLSLETNKRLRRQALLALKMEQEELMRMKCYREEKRLYAKRNRFTIAKKTKGDKKGKISGRLNYDRREQHQFNPICNSTNLTVTIPSTEIDDNHDLFEQTLEVVRGNISYAKTDYKPLSGEDESSDKVIADQDTLSSSLPDQEIDDQSIVFRLNVSDLSTFSELLSDKVVSESGEPILPEGGFSREHYSLTLRPEGANQKNRPEESQSPTCPGYQTQVHRDPPMWLHTGPPPLGGRVHDERRFMNSVGPDRPVVPVEPSPQPVVSRGGGKHRNILASRLEKRSNSTPPGSGLRTKPRLQFVIPPAQGQQQQNTQAHRIIPISNAPVYSANSSLIQFTPNAVVDATLHEPTDSAPYEDLEDVERTVHVHSPTRVVNYNHKTTTNELHGNGAINCNHNEWSNIVKDDQGNVYTTGNIYAGTSGVSPLKAVDSLRIEEETYTGARRTPNMAESYSLKSILKSRDSPSVCPRLAHEDKGDDLAVAPENPSQVGHICCRDSMELTPARLRTCMETVLPSANQTEYEKVVAPERSPDQSQCPSPRKTVRFLDQIPNLYSQEGTPIDNPANSELQEVTYAQEEFTSVVNHDNAVSTANSSHLQSAYPQSNEYYYDKQLEESTQEQLAHRQPSAPSSSLKANSSVHPSVPQDPVHAATLPTSTTTNQPRKSRNPVLTKPIKPGQLSYNELLLGRPPRPPKHDHYVFFSSPPKATSPYQHESPSTHRIPIWDPSQRGQTSSAPPLLTSNQGDRPIPHESRTPDSSRIRGRQPQLYNSVRLDQLTRAISNNFTGSHTLPRGRTIRSPLAPDFNRPPSANFAVTGGKYRPNKPSTTTMEQRGRSPFTVHEITAANYEVADLPLVHKEPATYEGIDSTLTQKLRMKQNQPLNTMNMNAMVSPTLKIKTSVRTRQDAPSADQRLPIAFNFSPSDSWRTQAIPPMQKVQTSSMPSNGNTDPRIPEGVTQHSRLLYRRPRLQSYDQVDRVATAQSLQVLENLTASPGDLHVYTQPNQHFRDEPLAYGHPKIESMSQHMHQIDQLYPVTASEETNANNPNVTGRNNGNSLSRRTPIPDNLQSPGEENSDASEGYDNLPDTGVLASRRKKEHPPPKSNSVEILSKSLSDFLHSEAECQRTCEALLRESHHNIPSVPTTGSSPQRRSKEDGHQLSMEEKRLLESLERLNCRLSEILSNR